MDERREVPTRVGPVPVRVTGEGPVVLAVHGLLLDGRLWDGVVPRLSPHARVVVPDLPLGAHRRPVPDRSRLDPDELAGALVDVLDAVGAQRAVLLGNDTGGALVQIAAAAHPGRIGGLVLTDCDAFDHFPPPVLRPAVPLAGVPGAARLLLRLLSWPPLLAEPGRWNAFTVRGLGRDRVRELLAPARTDPGVRADLVALVARVRPEPLLAAVPGLRALGVPAAVVWARGDRVFPARDAERLAALLGTGVTWLDDALTFSPVDRPDAVADAVRSVLDAVAG